MVVFTVVSMVYSFRWNAVVHHTGSWVIPGDIWSTFRAAHWVGWGDLGSVYGRDTQLVTFPGIAVLLAPVAMVSGGLGLSESIDPIFLSQPTSWLLLGPAILLLGSSCLVGLDAMAEELGAGRPHRIALCWAEAAVIFQVLAIWGHPEDLLALSLALYALLATFRGRWSLTGWLWGLAIVVQPLVFLMFPLGLSFTRRGQRIKVCLLGAVPTIVLVGTPLLANWRSTSNVLLHQANFPTIDHATPWVALAPHLTRVSVGAGPGRMIAVVAALGLGIYSARRRPSLLGLLWLCALALSLRCFFESVMVSFYLGPPLAAIVMVASSLNRWPRMVGAWLTAMIATVLAFHHFSDWGYWVPMVVLLAVGLALAWPGRGAFGPSGSIRLRSLGAPVDLAADGPTRSSVPVRSLVAPSDRIWQWWHVHVSGGAAGQGDGGRRLPIGHLSDDTAVSAADGIRRSPKLGRALLASWADHLRRDPVNRARARP